MEQVKVLEPFGDSETGRSYYPGLYTLVEDASAPNEDVEGEVLDFNAAQRALNAGVAEKVEENQEPEAPEGAPEEA